MKSINDWLEEYGESHQNKTNKLIHWICVPLIFWSIIALLSFIPNDMLQFSNNEFISGLSHWGTILILTGLLFYLRLSFSIFLGMLFFSVGCLLDIYLGNKWLGSNFMLCSSGTIFIIAWAGQFIGHKIEGKKPSFFNDLQFLLIGPAWLLSFIYKKLGIKY